MCLGKPGGLSGAADGDRRLFQQHDAHGSRRLPGAGHILIFNNGLDRGYSTIAEIVPPMDADGRYSIESGKPFGPEEPAWRYQAQNPTDFLVGNLRRTGCGQRNHADLRGRAGRFSR